MSKKLFLSYITVIVGSLILSLELIGLNLLKVIEKNTCKWYEYLGELPVLIAFFITIFIIALGIKIILTSINKNNN